MKEQYILITSIISVIFFAWLFPFIGSRDGPLVPDITTYVALLFIFLINGFCLETEKFTSAFMNFKSIFLTQFCAFFVTPLVMYIYVTLLKSFIHESSILKGLLIVGCMPPPVSLGVILTGFFGGNEAMAIINSAIGSISGVLISPFLVSSLLGIGVSSVNFFFILKLVCVIILPCLAGQTLRYFYRKKSHAHLLAFNMETWKSKLSNLSAFFLVFIIYVSFCDLFDSTMKHVVVLFAQVTLLSVIAQILFIVSTSTVVFGLRKFMVKQGNNDLYSIDIVAILTCSSMKSLTIGYIIGKSLTFGNDFCGETILPVLLFEPIQLIMGLLLTNRVKHFIEEPTKIHGSSILYGLTA